LKAESQQFVIARSLVDAQVELIREILLVTKKHAELETTPSVSPESTKMMEKRKNRA
jgi:hypothetical protein